MQDNKDFMLFSHINVNMHVIFVLFYIYSNSCYRIILISIEKIENQFIWTGI